MTCEAPDPTLQPTSLHDEPIPDAAVFAEQRREWRNSLADDEGLRSSAVDLQLRADRHSYTYHWEWCGVPIIRVPDDVMVLQELIWQQRPTAIVETGVARGGSLILNASLQALAGLRPNVLGIDIAIHQHTHDALRNHDHAAGIQILEDSSTSSEAVDAVVDFIDGHSSCLLVLDSNHTHDHVLEELRQLAVRFPLNTSVLVADTLIEELPVGHFSERPWDRGNSPASAIDEFLTENGDFVRDAAWGRRALVTEFRDGFLRRVQVSGD